MTKNIFSSVSLWQKIVLILVLILPYLGLWYIKVMYDNKVEQIANAQFIIVDKESMKLHLYDYQGNVIRSYGISCGRNYGNKLKIGDNTTPEGIFHIIDIENSSSWGHDFKDGKGRIEGAYGPWFLRLSVPNQKGIGIHGTHKPESIGTRDTEGCIRLKNEDIIDLKSMVKCGMVVIVLPSYADLSAKQKDSLRILGRNSILYE